MKFESHDVVRLQVFTTSIEDIDNEKLLNEINNTKNTIPEELISGFGKKTTHTWFEDGLFPWGKSEALNLIKKIEDACKVVSGAEMHVDEAWTITLNQGQSVTSHSHRSNWHMYPNEYLSAAYYVNAPEGSAPLIFEAGYCDIAQNTYSITPKTGMLVIFNSFMTQMTGRHLSEIPRVVVSSNLSPINPTTTRQPDLSPYTAGKNT
jgi:hypothetical protein